MTKEEKIQIAQDLSDRLAKGLNFYITDASGMNVAETNAFRRMCFEKNIEYVVVKNSLIKKALLPLGDFSEFDASVLKGFSGIMICPESANAPAKLLKEFRSKNPRKDKTIKPLLKGASINSDLFVGEDQLETLATLKSKADLIGEIIGLLQSPAKNVVSALQSGGNKIAGIVKTLSEKEG
ncbi:MAG: 50S ribosomal protein L10 [Thermoflexibacter sp.]|jgi:large subunit ribosomal protein L10|nr:50S ribosomal protein L10 [Thermoflexibacter sp.]